MNKKMTVVLVLVLILCFSLLTGCGKETEEQDDMNNVDKVISNPYEGYDLSEYIILPDYNDYTTSVPEVEITEEMVEEKIRSILLDNGTIETVKDGTVEKGDVITVSFSGKLADGSTVDGISADSFQLILGEEDMVDGFQEGIYGATIGEPFTLDITFPEVYEVKKELAGQTVTFNVEVLNKQVVIPEELDETFVREHSEASTVEEYRQNIRTDLEAAAYEEALQSIKQEIYLQIEKATEVMKLPEEIVEQLRQDTLARYKAVAEQYEVEWEEFLMQSFLMSQDDFDIQLLTYSREMVKQELIIYSLAEKENIEVSEEEYNQFLKNQLENSGYKDEAAFEQYVGKTVKEYVKDNRLNINLLLNKTLDVIYERLMQEVSYS